MEDVIDSECIHDYLTDPNTWIQ